MRSLTSRKIDTNGVSVVIKISMVVVAITLVCISIVVFKVDIPSLVVAFTFFCFYVQIPGMLIAKVFKLEIEHISTLLAIGFFAGYAFVILQYYICELLNSDILLYCLGPICSIVYLALAIKSRSYNALPNLKRISPILYIYVLIVLLFALAYTQLKYMNPEFNDYTSMHLDFAYHMGIINSLADGLPALNPWVYGDLITYHYYTEMLFAVVVRLFGLTADFMIMSVMPYVVTYAFSITLYSMFIELLSEKKKAPLYCLIFICSYPFMTNSVNDSWLFYHLFSNMNSFCFAACEAYVFIVLLRNTIKKINKNEIIIGEVIALLASIMLVTGIKGPVGLVLIGALWGTMILGLILRKLDLKIIPIVLVLTVGFFIIYYFVIGMGGTTGTNGQSLVSLAEIVDAFYLNEPLIECLSARGIPTVIKKCILLVAFMAFVMTVYFLPATIGYIIEFFSVVLGKKRYEFDIVCVYAIIFVGFIAMMLLNYNGKSQVYFGFTSMCFVPLITFRFFEEKRFAKNKVIKCVKVIFCISLIMTSISLVTSLNNQFNSVTSYVSKCGEGVGASNVMTLSDKEYEAMEYIRDNIKKDALLATDRYYSVPIEEFDYTDRRDCRFFLYAAYSEHCYFMEGTGYTFKSNQSDLRKEYIDINNQLYDPNNEERGNLARELGVEYIVTSKRFCNRVNLLNEDYTLVFSNTDIDIYHVAGN